MSGGGAEGEVKRVQSVMGSGRHVIGEYLEGGLGGRKGGGEEEVDGMDMEMD